MDPDVQRGDFLRYVGSPNIHDGTIVQIAHQGESAQVVIRTIDNRLLRVEFEGVESVRAVQPEGMLLYALSEMKAPPGRRRFVFANWEDDDPTSDPPSLEIVATHMRVQVDG